MPRFVITGSQMRALEEEAFRRGADALLLMERAAEGVVQNILEMAPEGRVLFVCGKGNNGADGLAAARILLREGGKHLRSRSAWRGSSGGNAPRHRRHWRNH